MYFSNRLANGVSARRPKTEPAHKRDVIFQSRAASLPPVRIRLRCAMFNPRKTPNLIPINEGEGFETEAYSRHHPSLNSGRGQKNSERPVCRVGPAPPLRPKSRFSRLKNSWTNRSDDPQRNWRRSFSNASSRSLPQLLSGCPEPSHHHWV